MGFQDIIWKWRRQLVILTLTAIVIAIIFSSPWFITPKFESMVIMYPASTSSLASTMMSEVSWSDEDLLEFGEKEQADQLKQVLESNEIRDKIIKEFDLKEHYRIDTDASYPLTRLWKEYERNVNVRINEYGAVELTVMDTDPQKAADIANKITALLDSAIHDMQRSRAIKAKQITLNTFERQREFIRILEDSLATIMARGVHDYESQAQVIYEELAVQLARQNKRAAAALEEKLEGLAEDGGEYISIRDALELEKERLAVVKAKYEKARMDARQELPQKFIITDAYKAERKAYPKQWLIVSSTGISTLLFLMIILWAIESSAIGKIFRRIRENSV